MNKLGKAKNRILQSQYDLFNFIFYLFQGLVVFITIVVGCSAENVESRVKRGLHHWGHADVNIPDSWVIMFIQNWVSITFLIHSIWRTMSEFLETSGSPETSRQKKGAKSAVNTWCTTTCSPRRYNSWEEDKEPGASSRIPMHAQDLEA